MLLIKHHHEADVLTIKQAAEDIVLFCFLPVLSTFLMTTATWPFSMELSSLTMRMRQVQRTSKDRARRMRPTARSGNLTLTKMCLPAMEGQKDVDDSL